MLGSHCCRPWPRTRYAIAAKQVAAVQTELIDSSAIQTGTELVSPSPVSPVAPHAVAEGGLAMWAAEMWFLKKKRLHSVEMTALLLNLLRSYSGSRGFRARQDHAFQTRPRAVNWEDCRRCRVPFLRARAAERACSSWATLSVTTETWRWSGRRRRRHSCVPAWAASGAEKVTGCSPIAKSKGAAYGPVGGEGVSGAWNRDWTKLAALANP